LNPPTPPPHSREFFFFCLILLSYWDIWAVFLMQNVPLDAAYLFDLHADILGWLLDAVQPKKQLPRHKYNLTSEFKSV
jgi:hypothetical protein